MKNFLVLIFISFLSACSSLSHKESPVIYVSNLSPQPINNIKIIWAGNKVLKLQTLNPGKTRSQSFYLDDSDDFFGVVNISWSDANHNQNSRDLYFKRNHMPSIDDHEMYSYVQIYLEQKDMEMLSSDAPDLGNITKKRDATLLSFEKHYSASQEGGAASLISVEPLSDREKMPAWISRSF